MSKARLIAWTLIRVAAAVAFAVWLVLHLRRWDHIFGISLPPWLRILGTILMCAGGVVVLLCGASLATRGILHQPGDRLTPASLSTSGPFEYSRNPMSLAVVTLFLGLSLYCLSPTILLFSGALFLFLHIWVISVEEPRLRRRFGQAYREYEQRTHRWRPRIR
jgi:protein-S-isoprenylcysteine O-methyltransferase Ste14